MWIFELLTLGVGVLLGATLTALFDPVSDRLRRFSEKRFSDHGIVVHVERDPNAFVNVSGANFTPSGFYASRFDSDLEPTPTSFSEWWRWGRRNGFSDIHSTAFLITLTATRDAAILVQFPRLHDTIARQQGGYNFYLPGRGGGDFIGPRQMIVDLDEDPQIVGYLIGDQTFSRSIQFSMNRGDIEQILVRAFARVAHHTWAIEFPLLVDGLRRSVLVGGENDPFMTAPPNRQLFSVVWDGDGWRLLIPPGFSLDGRAE